jgi:hypothetical protein
MYSFVKENQELFIALASILNTKGAEMSMECDFIDGNIKYSNRPVISGYMGPEGEGFYFRASRRYFGMSDLEFAQSFPILHKTFLVFYGNPVSFLNILCLKVLPLSGNLLTLQQHPISL